MGACGAKSQLKHIKQPQSATEPEQTVQQVQQDQNIPLIPDSCITVEAKFEFIVSKEITEILKNKQSQYCITIFFRPQYEFIIQKIIKSAQIKPPQYLDYSQYLQEALQKKQFEFEIYIKETENCKKGKELVAKSLSFLKDDFNNIIKLNIASEIILPALEILIQSFHIIQTLNDIHIQEKQKWWLSPYFNEQIQGLNQLQGSQGGPQQQYNQELKEIMFLIDWMKDQFSIKLNQIQQSTETPNQKQFIPYQDQNDQEKKSNEVNASQVQVEMDCHNYLNVLYEEIQEKYFAEEITIIDDVHNRGIKYQLPEFKTKIN